MTWWSSARASVAFNKAPVGVYFGRPGVEAEDPYFGGVGPRRTGCISCGNCNIGCGHNAKNKLTTNYLYLAEAIGVEVHELQEVYELVPLDGAAFRCIRVTRAGHSDRRTCTTTRLVRKKNATVRLDMCSVLTPTAPRRPRPECESAGATGRQDRVRRLLGHADLVGEPPVHAGSRRQPGKRRRTTARRPPINLAHRPTHRARDDPGRCRAGDSPRLRLTPESGAGSMEFPTLGEACPPRCADGDTSARS
jgi:hypothetical protein